MTVDIRFGMVAYRDYGDGKEYQICRCEFESGTDKLREFLKEQEAFGGNDGAEDVLGGLLAATELKWSSKARFLILIADSPGHGVELHGGFDDRYLRILFCKDID